MVNSDNRITPKKTYTISNEQMLKFIDKLPALKDNKRNTEFFLPAKTRDDVISDENELQKTKLQTGIIGSVNIHFSYDFVNDRWFLNDKNIDVIDRERS